MKRKRFPEETIVKALKRYEAGEKAKDLCREFGIHNTTFYGWKAKFGGMEVNDVKRLRELETENGRLKRLVADLTLDNQMLKEVNSRKW